MASDLDDSLSEAISLGAISTTAKTIDASITPDVDVDMYRFTVAAGQVVDFDIDTTLNGIGGLGSYIRLFNGQGQQLAFNNDAAAPGENETGFDAYLRYTFPSRGSFYVGISNFNNAQYDPLTGDEDTAGGQYATGSYAIVVQALPVDLDDSLSEAVLLGAISATPKTTDASITPDIDVDMYRFTASARQTVDFDIDTTVNGPGGLGSYLRLFNAQGQELASNNDAVAPGENVVGFDAYLRFTFATAGTYYIGVSNANSTRYSPLTGNGDTAGGRYSIGDYQLIVQTAPLVPQDTDDSLSEASSLGAISTTAQTVEASVTPDVDVDMYRFSVSADQVVDFDIDTALNGPGGLGSYIRLFNGQGQQLAFNNDATAPGENEVGFDAYLRYTFPSRGTFYVGISNYHNTQYDPVTGDEDTAGGQHATGSYALVVQALPVDLDDSLSEAVLLGAISTTPKTTDASITPDIDVDMYRFTASARQTVDFDIDTTVNGPGGLGSYLRLFDAQGQELAFNNDAAAPDEGVVGFDAYLRYSFTAAGTYYIGVSNVNNARYDPLTGNGDTAGGRYSIGDYQLIVQTAPVDLPDTDDSLSEASSLGAISTTAKTVEASVTPDVDVDMYRFSVSADQVVDFDIDTALNGPGGLGSYLRLFDAQGQELAFNNDAAAPGENDRGFDAYLRYTFPSHGTYYVGISNFNNAQYDPLTGDGDTAGGGDAIGSYQLTVQALPIDTDDSLLEATLLGAITTTAKTISAAITPDIDVDMYRFTVVAGQIVDFDIDTALNGPGGLGSYFRLFNAQGQELASNNDGAAPGENEIGFDAYLQYTFPTGGTFYAGISNLNNVLYDPLTGNGDAAGGGDAIGSYQLIVQAPQVGSPTLTVSINPAAISEYGGRATGTVTRSSSDISQLLVVTLDSSDTSEATVPATVTIPANQVSKTFAAAAVDDALLDGTQTVTITASALGYVGDSDTMDVIDLETLSVTISPPAISESGGTATGTVTRSNMDDSAALLVTLASNDTSEATVPTTITIPAGQTSTTFVVTGVNDSLGDGTQSVVVTASASGFASASAALDVTDDEGALVFSLSGEVLSEHGGTVLGTISRIAADTSQPLVVDVVSSDATAAMVPATVTIPTGQTTAVFTITGVDDAHSDGVQSATIAISAPGFQSAAKTVLVADDERPYQNPRNALDVDDDGFVSAKDALYIINILNEIGSGPAAVIMAQHRGNPGFSDTNGDNFISPIDALLVINRLRFPSGGSGEGEAPVVRASTSAAATSPLRAVLVDAVHTQATVVAWRPSPLAEPGNTRTGLSLSAVAGDYRRYDVVFRSRVGQLPRLATDNELVT